MGRLGGWCRSEPKTTRRVCVLRKALVRFCFRYYIDTTAASRRSNQPESNMSTQPVASQFRVVRPSAGIVSQHRTLSGAQRSLERQQRGAAAQGGYSQDYIEQRDDKGQYRAVAAEQDEE